MESGTEFAADLGRVSRRWRMRLNERLKHTGLTQSRWIALLHLSNSGPISQRELAERIGVEGPSVVRVLDWLEDQDLVARDACGDDRRVKLVRLTEEAEPILKELTRISDGLRREVLADISPEDLAVAHRAMRHIADKLEGLE